MKRTIEKKDPETHKSALERQLYLNRVNSLVHVFCGIERNFDVKRLTKDETAIIVNYVSTILTQITHPSSKSNSHT